MSLVSEERRKVKWSELSPSLQEKFKNLENKVHDRAIDNSITVDSVKITISDKAPLHPENDKNLWIDTKYQVLRGYSENNWEPTRAAWSDYKNDAYDNIMDKDIQEPGFTGAPPVKTKPITTNVFTYYQTSSGVTKFSQTSADGLPSPYYGDIHPDTDAHSSLVMNVINPVLNYKITVGSGPSSGGYFLYKIIPNASNFIELTPGLNISGSLAISYMDIVNLDVDTKFVNPSLIKPIHATGKMIDGLENMPTYPYPYDYVKIFATGKITRLVTPSFYNNDIKIDIVLTGEIYV